MNNIDDRRDDRPLSTASNADSQHRRRFVRYTATIITLDGSDTNAYGEACEPGHGYTEEFGWWNPDDDDWSVHPDPDLAHLDIYSPSDTLTPVEWLVDRLTDRLGPVEFDGFHSFHSSREVISHSRIDAADGTEPAPSLVLKDGTNPRRRYANQPGTRILLAAAHAHGLTDGEIGDAAHVLGVLGSTRPRPSGRIGNPAPTASHADPSMRGFVALGPAEDTKTLPGGLGHPPDAHEPGMRRGRTR